MIIRCIDHSPASQRDISAASVTCAPADCSAIFQTVRTSHRSHVFLRSILCRMNNKAGDLRDPFFAFHVNKITIGSSLASDTRTGRCQFFTQSGEKPAEINQSAN